MNRALVAPAYKPVDGVDARSESEQVPHARRSVRRERTKELIGPQPVVLIGE